MFAQPGIDGANPALAQAGQAAGFAGGEGDFAVIEEIGAAGGFQAFTGASGHGADEAVVPGEPPKNEAGLGIAEASNDQSFVRERVTHAEDYRVHGLKLPRGMRYRKAGRRPALPGLGRNALVSDSLQGSNGVWMKLPIFEIETELVEGLRSAGAVTLAAPTGSGKSTQVPQMLARHGFLERGEVIILQPRRLPARMLARRVAEEMGVKLGGLVGYQIRFDDVTSRETRIRFVTEGILIRRLLGDRKLTGVAAIVFDEFHERHLSSDLSLAMVQEIRRQSRPDLKIVVMSATLESERVLKYLEPCQRVESSGTAYPVTVNYLSKRRDPLREPIWRTAAETFARAGVSAEDGHVLIFMPGAYEIQRTLQELRNRRESSGWSLHALHGEMAPSDQDAAVMGDGRPRIIVSTNVAETSLTIDGVGVVIDSGQAKIARYDPRRGIDALLVENISRASADQRKGRAGRTRSGKCYRLWTALEDESRRAQETPEIKRVDLAEAVLQVKELGWKKLQEFPWLEEPEALALEHAEELLTDLGALNESGDLLPMGRSLLELPVHPRYGRALLAAREWGVVGLVSLAVGIAQGREVLLRKVDKRIEKEREDHWKESFGTDLSWSLLAVMEAADHRFERGFCERLGIHGMAARQALAVAEQLIQIMGGKASWEVDRPEIWEKVRRCMMVGFADRVAVRLDQGTLRCGLVHGRVAFLERESLVREHRWLVASEIREVRGPDGKLQLLLGGVSAIEEKWLREEFAEGWKEESLTVYDPTTRMVMEKRRTVFRGLLVDEISLPAPADSGVAAGLLAQEILSGRSPLDGWNEEVEQWIARINFLADAMPEAGIQPIGEAEKQALIEQLCYGAQSMKEVRGRSVLALVKNWVSPAQQNLLEKMAPVRMSLPSGRSTKISYQSGKGPVVSAKIQELFGVTGCLYVAGGKVPVTVEILAPNFRPVQVTTDLENFWSETYPKLKIELKRRYPKHEWR